ncbi:HSP20 family protein [Anoxybacillus vitaminiphilus]|jgi:HSP20 family protein|uniref:HSP20 family protein n=1 Tax=Paranoxybacillus vitaminiphilus TaxID=581036 RepID=A0A327YUU8_9BACL|nr:Hsp20/alpha crystallin family protein [Anoxybacillus vitaminiphilus]RAK23515.1 HSP20 family protein [Anoxybacillus vitaminiphilus]
MGLIPYDPFQQLQNFRRELDRLFFDFSSTLKGVDTAIAMPRIDIHETDTEVIATCDLPGLEKKEDVNIEIENNTLSLSGTIQRTSEKKEERVHLQERMTGHFRRTITLPSKVSTEGVKATYKNGVLEIRMPKLSNETKKKIDIDFI